MEKQINFELLQEMINCVKREVSMRYKVYPGRVKAGKMTEQEAEKEKALMYGVQIALQKIYDGNAPKPVQTSFINAQDYITKTWHG